MVRLSDRLVSIRYALTFSSRTFLTMLGLVIGGGSIVLLASLLAGGREALLRANQDVTDADLVEVYRRDTTADEDEKTRRELSRHDVETLARAGALGAASVSSQSHREAKALVDGKRKRVRVVAADASSLATYRLTVRRGRFVSDDDQSEGRRVAVVGHEIWSELFGETTELSGQSIRVDDEAWTIVGILAKKPFIGATDGTYIWDRKMLVPSRVYDAMYAPSHEVNEIQVKRGRLDIVATRRLVDAVLLRLHLGVRNFKVDDGKGGEIDTLVLGTLQALLLSTGLLSLFASGINVMNVMLVSVTERTREIGVRRAIGATGTDIALQFVLEAAAVSFVGGAIGVAFGAALAWGAASGLSLLFGSWPFKLEGWSVVLALALSLGTGVVFGLLPALRAAKIAPIVALRSE